MGADLISGVVQGFMQGARDGENYADRQEDRRMKKMEIEARINAEKEQKERQRAQDEIARKDKEFDNRRSLVTSGFQLPQLAEGQSIADTDLSKLPINKDFFKAKSDADPMAQAIKALQLRSGSVELENKLKPNQNEFAAGGFAKRAEQAEASLGTLLSGGFDPTNINTQIEGMTPKVAERFKSGKVKQYEQAKNNFISAVLRKESGAAIGKEERMNEDTKYFPQPGDTPEALQQKELARAQVIANLKAESGRAYDVIPSAGVPTGQQKGKFPGMMPGGILKEGMIAAPPPTKPKTIKQNGVTFTLNPQTGEYE